MSIRLLRFSELDLAAWDACVDSALPAVPYATSWWLQATAGRWDALVETEPGTGRYLTVWPLPVKWRLWGREIVQPPFTQQLGMIGVGAKMLGSLAGPWLALVLPCYARFYAQLNVENRLVAAPAGVTVDNRHTYHLPLHQPYETIQAGYCADYRRRLRKPAAMLGQVQVTPEVEPLLTLFRQTQGPAAGLKSRHYTLLRRLVAALQARQLLELHEVRHVHTGELLAGALFVRYRSRLIYLFAAASAEGKKLAAPLALVDAAIRRHAGTPGLVLDFEGGMIPSIARFFANFGAVPVPYAALSFTQRPCYLQWLR
ncbi:GNAT family N-acetyltransferase [Hymenobacter sp. 102]|uniref:GNAT family N-acetyltransferase n=1 Tax=Hymenobacter sp. 102 TaxID=3403152 RepID=UPI003CF514A9